MAAMPPPRVVWVAVGCREGGGRQEVSSYNSGSVDRFALMPLISPLLISLSKYAKMSLALYSIQGGLKNARS